MLNKINEINSSIIKIKDIGRNKSNLKLLKGYTGEDKISKSNKGFPTGGASEVEKTSESIELFPKSVAGVERQRSMSFSEADGGKVNPSYDLYESQYYNNCQSCVVAYEACRRGYDVEAMPIKEGSKAQELSNTLFDAWLNPKTKNICQGTDIDVNNGVDCYEYLKENVQQNARYQLTYGYFRKFENEKKLEAHTLVVEKNAEGEIIFYDPQSGYIREKQELKDFITTWMGQSAELNPTILRIDDKIFNPYYINEIVKPKT